MPSRELVSFQPLGGKEVFIISIAVLLQVLLSKGDRQIQVQTCYSPLKLVFPKSTKSRKLRSEVLLLAFSVRIPCQPSITWLLLTPLPPPKKKRK